MKLAILSLLLIPSLSHAQYPIVRAMPYGIVAGTSPANPIYIQWTPANSLTTDINLIGSSITFTNPGAITNPNYVQFNTAFADGSSEGRLQWNITDGTLEFGMDGGNINLQIGQELLFKARMTGAAGLNGQVVVITGATGNRPKIELADADNSTLNHFIVGVLTQDISQNADGYFNAFGYVRDVNTSAFADGDHVYLSTTPGGLTKTIPTYPAKIIPIGTITRSHPTLGSIFVSVQNIPDQIVVSSVTANVVVASSFTQTPELCLNGRCETSFPTVGIAVSSTSRSTGIVLPNGSTNFSVAVATTTISGVRGNRPALLLWVVSISNLGITGHATCRMSLNSTPVTDSTRVQGVNSTEDDAVMSGHTLVTLSTAGTNTLMLHCNGDNANFTAGTPHLTYIEF